MRKPVFAYGCGSPIKLPIVGALARGSSAKEFIPDANPVYRGDNSIVWGLMIWENANPPTLLVV